MSSGSGQVSAAQEAVEAAGESSSRRAWVGWIEVALIAAGILFCFGEAALLLPERIAIADTRSRIKADYQVWPQQIAPPVNAALLEEIRRDTPGLPTQLVVSGDGVGKPPNAAPPITGTQTPTPTATPYPITDAPPNQTPPAPMSSPNFPPTATQLVRFPTDIPTRVNPSVVPPRLPSAAPTRTPRPVHKTNTPEPPVIQASTPTYTSTASNTPTATLRPPTSTPQTPTDTDTPTNTPTSSATVSPTPFWAVGSPDRISREVPCGQRLVLDLGQPQQIASLIYFEHNNPFNCDSSRNNCTPGIRLDQMEIFLSATGIQGDEVSVFRWGDDTEENNGLIWAAHYRDADGERDNEYIPATELFETGAARQPRTGICIPVSQLGRYRFIVLFSPFTSPAADCDSDPVQLDTIGVNFNLDRCPTP